MAANPTSQSQRAATAALDELRAFASRIDARTLDLVLVAISGTTTIPHPETTPPVSGSASPNNRSMASHSPSTATRSSDASSQATQAPSPFSSRFVPPLSVLAYGRRLLKYNYCPPIGIILGIVLMSRYCRATGHRPTAYTVHRLMLTAVVVALKTHYDIFYSNQYYAQAGGISNAELNRLELALLTGLHFSAMASLREVVDITRALAEVGAQIPVDNAGNPVAVDLLNPDLQAQVTQAARTAGRVLCDFADLPQPFAGPMKRRVAPDHRITFGDVEAFSAAPSTASSPRSADRQATQPTGTDAHQGVHHHHQHTHQHLQQSHLSAAHSQAPKRTVSVGSALDSEYADTTAQRSYQTSRRASQSQLA